MTVLGEHMEAQTLLDTTSTTATLLCVGTRDEGIDEAAQLTPFIVSHFTVLAGVDDTCHVRDGNTSLSNVRGQHDLADPWWWNEEG
jgi:hypothetical protein